LTTLFLEHPSTLNKTLNFSPQYEDFVLLTDISLLERVLANMITNALEASEAGERVDVSIALETDKISFSVHNNQIIPDDVRLRVFQRNFSTKGGSGRGLGTFSMKLFGEKILGGKVSFTSRSGEGTVFTISLPL
jgi:signal transduction histidine kinase